MTQVALLEAKAELEGAGLQCSFSQRDQGGRLLFSAQADQVQTDINTAGVEKMCRVRRMALPPL